MSFGPVSKDVKAGELRVVVPASGRASLSALSLEVGKSLLARVVAQNAEEVTLSLLGRLVACRSELDLPQGGLVNLLVREVRPDRIVLSPQPLPSGNELGATGEQEILRSLGLPDSPEAVTVARRLLAEGHPLEQRLFQEVWQGLKRLGLIERSPGQTGQAEQTAPAGTQKTAYSGSPTGAAPATPAGSQTADPAVASTGAQPGAHHGAQAGAQANPQAEAALEATDAPPPAGSPTGRPAGTPPPAAGAHPATPAAGRANPLAGAPANAVLATPLTASGAAGPMSAGLAELGGLAALGGDSFEPAIDAVAFLAANDRPVTPESVRATLAVRDSAPGLGSLVGDLAKAVDGLAAQSARNPGAYSLPAGLLDNLRELQGLLADLRFSPLAGNASLDALSRRLQEVLTKLGLDYERGIGLLLGETPSDSQGGPAAALSHSVDNAAGLVDDAPPARATAVQDQNAGGKESAPANTAALPGQAAEVADQAGRAGADPRGTLKGLLLALRDRLAQLDTAPATQPPAGRSAGTLVGADEAASLARLAKSATEALDNLTGQRLGGQASERPGQPPVELLVQIPVQVGKETHTAELKFFVDREKKNRHSLLQDTVRVSCRLTTTNLGPVRLDLNLRGKSVDCHLTLANEAVLAYMHEHQAELQQALQDAGFATGNISYARHRPEETPSVAARPLSHLNVRL